MRAKTCRFGALLIASLVTLTSFSFAAEATEDSINQGQAAKLVANYMGLFAKLPGNPSEQESINALMEKGISPFGSWEMTKTLTVADFAKIIVEAMGRSNELSGDVNDPKTYIQFLKGQNVPVESVSETLAHIPSSFEGSFPERVAAKELLSDPLSQGFEVLSFDPADGIAGNIGFGSAPMAIETVLAVIETLPTVRRRATTPR